MIFSNKEWKLIIYSFFEHLVLFLRFYIITVLFLLVVLNSLAQNLVPNGDFETYTECPDGLDQLIQANGWKPYRNTPDYFNGCDETQLVGTPLNLMNGFQEPLSGEGYGGLIAMTYNNGREIMGIELSEPLNIGEEYYIEFYWSRTFGGFAHSNCNCASSHLGALLTTEGFDNILNPISHDNFAHVYETDVMIDSTNWNLISGWITADEAYTHIAIGDFFDLDSNNVDFLSTDPNEVALNTYYYIENVCVSQNPADCGLVSNNNHLAANNEKLEIYPNPTTEKINVKTESLVENISVIDINGKEVLTSSSNISIDVSGLTNGMYILIVKTNQGVQRRKFLKTP